jgi:hypothetical protein
MREIQRYLQAHISKLMEEFPCVAVLGARQMGKSTLLKQVLPNAPVFDLEKASDFELIYRDTEFFLNDHAQPLILDEAQILPELFTALRVKIDQNRQKKGQYLISGSSSPELLKNISESLAGRVALIELNSLLFSESFDNHISSFYTMIAQNDFQDIKTLLPLQTKKDLYTRFFFGGYPEPFLQRDNLNFFSNWQNNYLQTYLQRDVRKLFPNLSIQTYQRFLKILSFSL